MGALCNFTPYLVYSALISFSGLYTILEFCCLKINCKPTQSVFIGLSDSHHNLASPTKVKQNLCSFNQFQKSCVSIQLFILSKCASTSPSGLPAYSGLNWDQFNCGLWGTPSAMGALGKKGF